ncbi:PGPGW domain-containing protein [Cellulomonas aerilata]|uniref:Transmembrane protein PGPGW n=1 Tax=Cellulomonas aerilata TaxID=515326 RepID=A0A512DFU2_9CELL|nr:PGPGW domain-containing protein [Cellulomonas aerilata]GEO35286.1 hypothetical protein CAE01nite_30110 [Cellulomonas aerilata]
MLGRVAVAVVGGALTLAGVALLVLPGPGFVLVAAGLAILATKFAWAARPLAYAKDKAQVGLDEVAQSKRRTALALVGAVSLLAAGILEVAGVDLPLVNLLTASMLLLSGLGLLGTIVYARRRGVSGSASPGAAPAPEAGRGPSADVGA